MAGNYYRISSSTTLFFKIFLPTFWIVFFGSLLILILFYGEDLGPAFTHIYVKVIALVLFVLFMLLMWFTVMSLKRIELTPEAFFVTNYFKTFRYTYDSVVSVHERDFLILKILVFRFKTPSTFGKKIFCIKRGGVWRQFNEAYPELLGGKIG